MNVIQEIQRLNERELEQGISYSASWHQRYKESAWVYIGNLSYELCEGDIICVWSQWGEVEDIHLLRDEITGKSKGFCFLKYADQRSTVLAVDNMNGATLLDRLIRVDHVEKYRLPKHCRENDDGNSSSSEDERVEKKQRGLAGHAYDGVELEGPYSLSNGYDVFAPVKLSSKEKKQEKKRLKKQKKEKKKQKKLDDQMDSMMSMIAEERQNVEEPKQKESTVVVQDTGPSKTGWRGRFEPVVAAPERSGKPRLSDAEWQEEKKRRATSGYGGIKRTR